MRNYNHILVKANCGIKHIGLIPNGINTQIFAFLLEEDCLNCGYKSFCKKIAGLVQKQAQLEKEVKELVR